MTNRDFSFYDQMGFEPALSLHDGNTVESWQLRPLLMRALDRLSDICNSGRNVEVRFSVCEDALVINLVDPTREVTMSELPTFDDFVSEDIARYLEIKQKKLRGDENVQFILNKIKEDLRTGRWRIYLEQSVGT